MQLVNAISPDILPGDVVWFARQDGYGKPLRKLEGEVMDADCPDGEWDVNVSGAVMRVKHRDIFGHEQTEQE